MSVSRVLVFAGLLSLAAAGLTRLSSSSHYSVYFDESDPALLSHQGIQNEFVRGESLLVLLEANDGDFLAPERWFLLEDLSTALRQLPAVNAVIAASELGIGGVVETDSGQLIPDREALVQHGRVFGLLLSDDAELAAVVVDVDLPDHRAETVLALRDRIGQVVEEYVSDHPVDATYTGTLAMGAAYVEVVRSDLRIVMPLLLVTMLALIGSLLGGIRTVVAILPLGLAAVIAAFGVAGWLSAELAAINTFAPIMILSISVAGCVHMVLAYQRARGLGESKSAAATTARREVMLPMTVANGTTVLGFLALLLSPSPPVRTVGFTVATGIAVSWLACILLLPGLLARLDPRWSRAQGLAGWLAQLARIAANHRVIVLTVALIAGALASVLVTQNRVSDSVFDYFPGSHPFSAATEIAETRLSGVNEILYEVDTGTTGGVLDAATIRSLVEFSHWLEAQPGVRRVSSLLDSELAQSAIEEDRLDSLLERLRQREPAGLELRELNADRSRLLVAAYVEQLDSGEIVNFDEKAKEAAPGLLPGFTVSSGGASLIFARLGEANIKSMLLALSLGLVVASVVFGAILRSFVVVVVGLACNVLPILGVYGVWAVLNGNISIGAATVMGMVLGIVIDDTVYLLTAWWRERNRADAVGRAVAKIGPALVTTSIVLASGLATGLLSDFLPVWSMSVLSAAIILTALLVDLVVLPAMLAKVSTRA